MVNAGSSTFVLFLVLFEVSFSINKHGFLQGDVVFQKIFWDVKGLSFRGLVFLGFCEVLFACFAFRGLVCVFLFCFILSFVPCL